MEHVGLQVLESHDLTYQVKKTWSICLKRAVKSIFTSGPLMHYLISSKSTEKAFVKTVVRMWLAYHLKSLRYVLLSARKIF